MQKNRLSNLQRLIYLDQKLNPDSPKYNIGGYVVINGIVEFAILKKSIDIFIGRTSLLKSIFREENGVPFRIEKEKIVEDWIRLVEVESLSEVVSLMQNDFALPFNIESNQALCTFWLAKTKNNKFIWYTKLHHLIADGYSFQLLFNEISRLYSSLSRQQLSFDPAKSKAFFNLVQKEEEYYQSQALRKDKSFWVNRYESLPELIYNHGINEAHFYNREFDLSETRVEELKSISNRNNLSMFSIFLASFSIVLSRFYYTQEINFGTPILNRLDRSERKVFGPLINLLPLQIELDGNLSLLTFIRQIKRSLYQTLRHQRFQQAELIKALSYQRNRLYDVRISYEKFHYDNHFAEYETDFVALSKYSEEDPISIHIMDYNSGGLKFRFDVNGSYVQSYIVDELIDSFNYVLGNLNESLEIQLKDLSIISPAQKDEIYTLSTGLKRKLSQSSFPKLWGENIDQFAQNRAISCGDQVLTYSQVNTKMGQVVSYLQRRGIGAGERVAILFDRSIDVIPTILGILAAGASYVPLDKSFPQERISFILKDSSASLLIADSDLSSEDCPCTTFQNIELEKVDKVTDKILISSEDEAYVIYTSGTTGHPKGVSIKHESLLDYVETFSNYFKLEEHDNVLQQSSLVFDTSVEEIFPILSVGGLLTISENPKDFHLLLNECSDHRISLLSTNPFVVQYLNDNHDSYKLYLKTLISGGDVLKWKNVENIVDIVDVYNTYGPTESTVCATFHKIGLADYNMPIGKPIDNRDVFIVNSGHLLPKGALGEITLAGKGLAFGYINNKKLSSELFTEFEGQRVYKTGDLGLWDQSGNLLFYGRKDKQLSIRGYRIEPEEIEEALKSLFPSINSCLIVMKDVKGVPSLLVYYSAAKCISSQEILYALGKKIPKFMIPNHSIQIDKFPLNSSGKVDIDRLPLPKTNLSSRYRVIPSTNTEKEIHNIWQDLLNLEDIDIHGNFFEMGGHSLLANQFISLIRKSTKKDLSLREFYEAPTIHECAQILDRQRETNRFEILKAPIKKHYPLSYSQERLWFLDQLNKENKSYYVPRAIKMTGSLNLERIEKVFTILTKKHEILRTVFPVVEGVPYQKVLAPYDIKIPLISFAKYSHEERKRKVESFILEEGNLDFDLENGPLIRIYILQNSIQDNILLFCEHHLIHDGWTQGVLLREFIETYSNLIEDEDYEVSAPMLQFKDFAYWQKNYFTDERLSDHLQFWKQKLKGSTPVLPLPQKSKRPQLISGNGKLLIRTIDEELSDRLRLFSAKQSSTLFITMLAAFKITLSRFSNELDICIGTAVANRRLSSIANILGMVINTIALRTQLSETDTLGVALDKIRETCFEAYSHEDTPFGKIVEHLSPKRSLGLMPFFQYMFSFMNTPSRNLFLPDLELEILDSHNLSAKFDINVVVVTPFEQANQEGIKENDRRIIVEWEYNSDIYSEVVMNQMLNAYFNIIETMISEPQTPFLDVAITSPIERQELIEDYNNSVRLFPKEKSIVDLFHEQVVKCPDYIAIVYGNTSLTYRELDHLSNALAHFIKADTSIGRDDIIGIQLSRSHWSVIAMLGILKSGAAYVTIDTNSPSKRVNFMIEDCACKLIVDQAFIDKFNSSHKEISSLDIQIRSDQLAYVIYTSGSTGKPKGVMVEHRNLVNFLCGYELEVQRTSLTCKTIFDVSVFEIIGSITSGSTLVIPDEEITYNPIEYAKFLYNEKISHCYLHPMHLEEIAEQLSSYSEVYLRKILIGVEGIKPSAIKWYFENDVQILNAYGPTECTICSTSYLVENLESITTPNIPIGKPLDNYQVYILSATNRLQPKGVIGELAISGSGVSRGYLNRPELTKEKFIDNPFIENSRLYKTGDLARWLPDGNIEFLGRQDSQVKVRGFRIELGEIEYALNDQEEIDQSVVQVVHYNDSNLLVGYFTSKIQQDVTQIKHALGRYLPEYMIPSHLVQIEEIPLTSTGKIDRNSLPTIELDKRQAEEYVSPRNSREKAMADIWGEVLGFEKVGILDNFFELGGHSLKVTQLINKMNRELSLTVNVRDVFQYPTVATLSEKVGLKSSEYIPRYDSREYYPLSSSQRRLWILSHFDGGNLAYNIPGVFKMQGELNLEILNKSFQYLIERHESLRTKFVIKNSTVFQQIVPYQKIDFSIESHDIAKSRINDFITNFYNEEFDLFSAPLIKVDVAQVGFNDYYLLFAIHHLVGDGWSIEVITRELMHIYHRLLLMKPVELPKLRIQYPDFAIWSESEERQKLLEEQKEYWLEKFLDDLPILQLPTFKKRPQVKTYNGATQLYQFSKQISNRIREFGQNNGATLYMSLLAGVNCLFYRYTGATDIILGCPIAGRSHSDLENQIGLYLNTLAIRTYLEPTDSFISLLLRQKNVLLEAYEHQEYSLESLINELNIRRDTSRSGLFDVMVVLQNQREIDIDLHGLKVQAYDEVTRSVSQFDMTFSFTDTKEGLKLRLEYNRDIYSCEQVTNMCRHLELLLESGINSPQKSIRSLEYIDEEEQQELLHNFNDTYLDYEGENTVVHLIREQASANPNGIAIFIEDRQISYHMLERLSNAMANDLLSTGLIGFESFVGIELRRTEWLVISIIAVLKAGGAYVPIDPSYPQERIDFIKEDSDCVFVVTEKYLENFKEKDKDYSLTPICASIDQLSHIIYTSGSTGKPKGVMIEHGSVSSLIRWSIKEFNSDLFDIVYFSTSHCFDLSVYEIFYPLTTGKAIRILENGMSIPSYLERDKRVLVNTVPSIVQSLIENRIDLSSISILNMAGEVVPPSFTYYLPLKNMEVYNLYGPSEDTTYSTYYKIKQPGDNSISIGAPISNTKVFILSDNKQLVPKGVVGEIYLSGQGLSRGYLNRNELTSLKFISNPFQEGSRLYQTGDLARWLPDGNIEFIGRIDHQVKLRGYRIELGEVESLIQQESHVIQAAVDLVKVKNERSLVAYYVADQKVPGKKLKESLSRRIPHFMIPSYYVQLSSFPLNVNGKLDRKALPPVQPHIIDDREYVAPRNKLESQLSVLWEDVLEVDTVGVTDNFFDLGGHSLKALVLLNKMHSELSLMVNLKEIFSSPTIRALSDKIRKVDFEPIPKRSVSNICLLSSTQRRIWMLSQLDGGTKAYTISSVFRIEGDLDLGLLNRSFHLLINRHESLRSCFKVMRGDIYQFVHGVDELAFEVIEKRASEDEVNDVIEGFYSESFDLRLAPLIRVCCIRTKSNENYLCLAIHHIIGDGWSLRLILNEITKTYYQLYNNKKVEFSELRIQYSDYVLWMESKKRMKELEVQGIFWRKMLSGELPLLNMRDTLRPRIKTYNGHSLNYDFAPHLLNKINKFNAARGMTLYMSLFASINALLYYYTGESDSVIGCPVSGRSHPDLKDQVGLFVNTLVIRTCFNAHDSFEELLVLQKEILLEAYEHQDYPFERLVSDLRLKKDLSRSSLFDIVIVLQDEEEINPDLESLLITKVQNSFRGVSQFDLTFSFVELKDKLNLTLEYNCDIYEHSLIQNLCIHLNNFIEEFLYDSSLSIEELLASSIPQSANCV